MPVFIIHNFLKMKKLFILLCFAPVFSFAQNDSAAIRKTIQALFDGMRKGDSAMVHSAFYPNAALQTAVKNKAGEPELLRENLQVFIEAVGTPHSEVWNEIIWNYEIRIDSIMATVWAPYTFYLDEKLSHCGVNAFTMMKSGQEWKIISILDTRRKNNCREK